MSRRRIAHPGPRVPGARLALLAALVAACSGGPILANPTLAPGPVVTPAPTRPATSDPQPIVLPDDDAPHDRLTEWWYYTGHLRDDAGGRWGFEFVIFRAERGGFPVTWASHVALTDEVAGTFQYAQRAEIGPQVAGLPLAPIANSLTIRGEAGREAWSMLAADGLDELFMSLDPAESPTATQVVGLTLALSSQKPPVLHDGDGWLDFGPAGGSYYYSRTAMTAGGTLVVDGERRSVEGTAWFDHQWGDFIAVGGGGWDWFAVNLEDGTDLTISLVRAADGSLPLVYGTLVDAAGTAMNLSREALEVEADPARTWTSPATGATYPAGWTIRIPGQRLVIGLEPTVSDQELDTRATTGVVYWEGSQVVEATRDGTPVAGEAYVELTGYAPARP